MTATKSIFEKAYIVEAQAIKAAEKEFGAEWSRSVFVVKEEKKFIVKKITDTRGQIRYDEAGKPFKLENVLIDDGHSLGDAMANATMAGVGLPQRLSSIKSPVKRVWDIADSMPKASRKDVVAECIRQGVGAGTARTQYQAWFKASQESKREDIRQPYEKAQKSGE